MEYIGVLIKALATLLITIIYNKIISIFRKRHLYATVHSVIQGYYEGKFGSTFFVEVGNVGKNKESSVVLGFGSSEVCKLVSKSYIDANARSNTVLIDRVLSGQKINLCVFVDGIEPVSKKNKPDIKSEDCKGNVYFGYGKAPVDVGPLILTVSFLGALLSIFFYPIVYGGHPLDFYNKVRYWGLYETGFSVDGGSDKVLLSSYMPWDTDYPIRFISKNIDEETMYMEFAIENITENKLELDAGFHSHSWEYFNELGKIQAIAGLSLSEEVDMYKELDKKYNLAPSEADVRDVIIEPGEVSNFTVSHPGFRKLKKNEIAVKITVAGYDGKDEYIYRPKRE